MVKRSRSGFYIFLFLFVALAIVGAAILAPFVIPVLLGVVLSIISRPAYEWLRSKSWRPKLAALAVVVAILVLIVGPLTGFAIAAAQQGIAVAQALSENGSLTVDGLVGKIGQLPYVGELIGNTDAIEKNLRATVQNVGKAVVAGAMGIAAKAPALVLQLFLTLVTVYFLLIDGKRLVAWLRDKSKLDPEVERHLSVVFRDTSFGVILSTIAAASTQGALMFVTFLLLGVPGAFLAAGATFILAWIPILGSTPVWVIGTVYLYLEGSLVKAVLMLVAGAIVGVADNFVRPLVLKGRSGIHPLVSLIAIFGGIELFGILGVFFGPILAQMLISTIGLWPIIREKLEAEKPAEERSSELLVHGTDAA